MAGILDRPNRHLFLEDSDNTGNSFIANVNDVADYKEQLNTVATDIENVHAVGEHIDKVKTVADNIQDISDAVDNINTVKTFNDNVNNGTMQHLLEAFTESLNEEGNVWAIRLTKLGESIVASTSAFNYSTVVSVSSTIASGGTLTLPSPMKYKVGTHMLMVSWNGTVCYAGDQYNEVGAYGVWSTTITWNHELREGDRIQFRIVALADSSTLVDITETALNSTEILATGSSVGRTLPARFGDIVNVKDFGATGDGVTDDTQAFLNAGATNSNVFVPKGTYVVRSSISGSFFSIDDVIIEGSGNVVIKSWKTLVELYELTTGGKRTIRFNKDGVPSIFYKFPMYYLDDIVSTWPHKPHPAFIVNNPDTGEEIILREILIGCYEASLYDSKYFVSQPNRQPFSYQPFDIQVAYCRANNIEGGISVNYSRSDPNNYIITKNNSNASLDTNSHFHMITNAEYSAVALWLQKKGYDPRGNSWYGCNGLYTEEKGTFPNRRYNYNTQQWEDYNGMPGDSDKNSLTYGNCPTLTGSSPLAWMHDNSPLGIENLVGNANCFVAGTRVLNGQIQSFVNNNAALPDADFCGRTPLSPDAVFDTKNINDQRYYDEQWKGYKAFNIYGEFVRPDDNVETLKYDGSYTSIGVATSSTDLIRGCGTISVNTTVAIPDSGASDLVPMSYDEETGNYNLDPNAGVVNGSAHQMFYRIQISSDDPSVDATREVDCQPNYMMRCLGLFPVCAHSDLYDTVAIAKSTEHDTTNPNTGIRTEVTHDGYYYNSSYITNENRDELTAWYGTQSGRMWTRATGELCHFRGGTYYYEDPSTVDTTDNPRLKNCALWTQSFSAQRYDRIVDINDKYSDLGVGWMTGTRLCVIEY